VRLETEEYLEDAAYRNASPPSAQEEQNHLLPVEAMEQQVEDGHYIPENNRFKVCLGTLFRRIMNSRINKPNTIVYLKWKRKKARIRHKILHHKHYLSTL
jgi:hypothetical protein